MPGLATLRGYEAAWLRHDVAAGLVLATMLVPVGIAYAVASGLPGIYGLYATIVPLLAYALFGPSRILVLGPDSSLAPIILGVVVCRSPAAIRRAPWRVAGMMAIVSGAGLHPRRRGAARLRHRASVQADPLRLHERHRADGDDQPAAEAASASRSRATGRCRTFWAIVEALLDGQDQLAGIRWSAPARWR